MRWSSFRDSRTQIGFLALPVLILSLFLLLPTASLQQQSRILYVNNADPTCQGQTPCYATIQAAVESAQAGDAIRIQAGTYQEQVNISGKNNFTGAAEADRIIIQADPSAPVGSVTLTGTVNQCTNGYAIRLQQSKYITIRGVTITGAGGQAISLMGGNNQNQGIHIERDRIFGNGSSECNGGITIARGNPDTLILNNLIYGNGRNGITFIDADGGPHYLINNTIHGNAWSGVNVARSHDTYLVSNLITGNGTASGSTGGRYGVSRESSTSPQPAGIHLLHNLICGNSLGEINGPALDTTDSNNLTPTGTEGSGVLASPGCEIASTVFANLNGPDGQPYTADDDFTLATGSPAIDRGMDARTLGLDPALNALFEADYATATIRPQDSNGDGAALFEVGARELLPPNRPPVANAGLDQIVNAGTLVTLNGSASFDPDGDPITFQWTQLTGPTASLATPTAETPTFTAPQVSTQTALTFELRVSDGPLTSTASVTITVLPTGPPGSRPPALSGFSPTAGPVGTTVTLVGADLDTTTQLTFAGRVAAFTVASPSQVIATVPAGATSGPIMVTTPGGTATSQGSFTVTVPPTITIATPAEGATIPATSVQVRGMVTSSLPDVGVSVNGFPAQVNGGQWIVEVPLETGSNVLTATALDTTGAQATASVTVTVPQAPPTPLLLRALPESGVAPLVATWQVINQTGRPLVLLELDPTGTGTFGPPIATLDGIQTGYPAPGLWFPTVRATDDQGSQYTATVFLNVEDPQIVTARFQSRWNSFKASLQAGDLAGALAHLTPEVQPQFQTVFQQLGTDLPAIVTALGDLQIIEQSGDLAETVIVQHENGVPFLYFIYFRRDSLGRWLIEEM
jgi:hypothetical protein